MGYMFVADGAQRNIPNESDKLPTSFKKSLYSSFLQKEQLEDNIQYEIIYEYSLSGLIFAFNFWYKNQDTCKLDDFIETIQHIIQNGTLECQKKYG